MTVQQRIVFGFGLLALFVASLGAWAYISLAVVVEDIAALEDMSGDALLASELNADMAKVLLNTNNYIRTRSDEALQSAGEFIRQMGEGIKVAEDEIRNPARVELLRKIKTGMATLPSVSKRWLRFTKSATLS